jgi:NADPH2:quinone reductase
VEGSALRAWQVQEHGEPSDALRRAEAAVPPPGAGQIRVRVAAAALGLPDVLMCRGTYPLTPALPFTPGQEGVGVVLAAGAGAEARVGERVMAVSAFYVGHGAFAEEALAVDSFAFPVPDSMPDEQAAGFVIPYHTAYVGLVRRGQLRKGETLLVLGGSGGTGSAAIQLGRALGARVLSTARGAERVAFCRELGADVGIDRGRQDVAEAVREATAGRGADVIYDPVGGEAFEAAVRCIAHEGRLLSVEIAVPVSRAVPFDELPPALDALGAGRETGKVVLTL